MFLRATLVPSAEVREQLRLVCGQLATVGLRPVLPDDLEVVLARFGNVTNDVAETLATALDRGLAALPGCAIALSGPRVEGRLVVADLRGEVAQVAALAGAVARTAEAARIYVDRRVFRHGIVVAELDQDHHGSAIEQRLGRMTEWYSSAWLADEVSLIRTAWHGETPVAEPWCAIPLAVADQSPRIALTSGEA
ncbi:MAG TPA: hypothetical protein VJ872_11285 [Nocardioides sp.]|nr:hypothetical protein [Nocardioides sp.]